MFLLLNSPTGRRAEVGKKKKTVKKNTILNNTRGYILIITLDPFLIEIPKLRRLKFGI